MSKLTEWMDQTWYPAYQKNWDDILFRERIMRQIQKHHKILDVGAGAGIVAEMNFRGGARYVCGIDPDTRVKVNPYLDEGKVGAAENIPYPDATFDVVFSDNVLEHLAAPEAVFREIGRVLKPGGAFLVKTPNKWHYMPLMARLSPHWFHQFVNRLRGRKAVDTFPTLYKVNTPADLRAVAKSAGLEVQWVDLIEGRPEYMRILAPAYFLGYVYERLVNAVPWLSRFRILMVAQLKKPQ